MSIHYLKQAPKTAATDESSVRDVVKRILDDVRSGGEERARAYAVQFDGWHDDIIVSRADIDAASAKLSEQEKRDIQIAHARVKQFAQAQRDSMHDFEYVEDGVTLGHKHIAVNTAGCYVPGGRYAHIASAMMSVTTAKVAGVKNIVACSPGKAGVGVHPSILYTLDLCGVDTILALGGVQGIAAMAFGLFTGHKADILVGPGNAYVAEAKRMLFGEVGIDLFAGPTESAVIADETADSHIVATDLVSQAEHGVDSPVWLFTTSQRVAEEVLALMPQLIDDLPPSPKQAATAAWRDYGTIAICDTREEVVALSDSHGAEHLQVIADDLAWWHANLTTYGSIFLGEETTVTYGDKVSGPNHILPTKNAARYTGGLNVSKFIKTLTYQKMTRAASLELGPVAARISRAEGMEAHARSADVRMAKYG
ncbi:MAG: histidinol dehydrogenase [Chloroflexota bacterium]